jgi:ribosome-associated heat shock protein Hsp15
VSIKAGDLLDISIGDVSWSVTVRALNAQRRPAPEARLLYEETEGSRTAREALLERKSLANERGADIRGRPTKRERRHLQRLLS